MKFEQEFRLAIEAAQKAGEYLKENNASVHSLVGKDIKLENDRKSEDLIVSILKKTGIPILSEERGLTEGTTNTDLKWIVDPLDGSANFWKGMRELTCVSVALWEKESPVIGIVNRFHTGELFSGITGEGAFLNGESIYTSDVTELNKAVFATGFPVMRSYESDSLNQFIRRIQEFKKIRMLGAAAVMGAFVACGRVDAYREDDIMLWDIAASSALVKAAGGYVQIIPTGGNKCICSLFGNESLWENFKKIE